MVVEANNTYNFLRHLKDHCGNKHARNVPSEPRLPVFLSNSVAPTTLPSVDDLQLLSHLTVEMRAVLKKSAPLIFAALAPVLPVIESPIVHVAVAVQQLGEVAHVAVAQGAVAMGNPPVPASPPSAQADFPMDQPPHTDQ
jgi:hypothetical protein